MKIDISRVAACVFAVISLSLISGLILLHAPWSNVSPDTQFHPSAYDMLARYSSLFSNAIANPLSGLFDIFPHGLRLDLLPNLIGRALFGPGMSVNFFLICCAILWAGTLMLMARTVGMRWSIAASAGILMPMLTMPVLRLVPVASAWYTVSITSHYSGALTVLVGALFWKIDNKAWTRFVVLTLAILAILIHLSVTLAFFVSILAPAMVAVGLGALAASKTRAEFLAKLLSAVIIACGLAAAGIFHYLYAIGVDNSYHAFFDQLDDFMSFSRPTWADVLDDVRQVIPFDFYIPGIPTYDNVLMPLSQLGILYIAIWGETREARIFGRAILAWIVVTIATIVFFHHLYYFTGLIYKGPHPYHLIPILWPYYAIGLAYLLVRLFDGVALLARRLLTRRWTLLAYGPPVALILVLGAACVFTLGNSHPNYGTFADYRHRTPIIDYLENNIGVALDRDFRGSILAMPSDYRRNDSPYYVGYRQTSFGVASGYLGNDMGYYGLWHYNIPSPYQYTENITPQYYLLIHELLSRPGVDVYDKHFPQITRLNQPIMQLMGLRYLLADYGLPIGTQRMTMEIPPALQPVFAIYKAYKSPLRIYELDKPNVGNYSPTHVVHASTAKKILIAMQAPGFDGSDAFVTDDARIGDALVGATDSRMTVRLGGVAVHASSSGQSVLVLPVQFSHCWQIVAGSDATLFRADLMFLGVRFSGNLDIELRQLFGPFWQSSCRVRDAEDVEHLKMADAMKLDQGVVTINAEGKPPYGSVAGDGINLLPASDGTLGQLFTASAGARVTPVPSESGGQQTYRMTAVGAFGEHYLRSQPITLPPGSYTISMQARPEHGEKVQICLCEPSGMGPLAMLDMGTQTVTNPRSDDTGRARAGFERDDDGWFHFWMTGTITDNASIVLWLSDSNGVMTFLPGKEAVAVRALQLEHGETPSSYRSPSSVSTAPGH